MNRPLSRGATFILLELEVGVMELLSRFMRVREWRMTGMTGLMSLLLMCSSALCKSLPRRRRLRRGEYKGRRAALAGHNAWMLTSSALVLFMTAPGLAMFYGGLVRKKNVLGVIMQCLFLMAMMTVIWGLYGYSLAFGDPDIHCAQAVHRRRRLSVHERRCSQLAGRRDCAGGAIDAGADLHRLTHMLFQGMFFIITPALICGAFAERMKFSAMALFLALWGTVVYIPLCHMVWGGGLLAYVPVGRRDAC